MDKTKVFKYAMWVAIGAVFIGFIYLVATYDSSFNSVDLSHSPNSVATHNVPSFMDTVAHVGLKEADLESLAVNIYPIPPAMSESSKDDLKLDAYVVDGVQPNTYSIFIDTDISKTQSIAILSHEIIHIQQRDQGRLIINEHWVVFEGDTIGFKETPYLMRP